MDRAAPDWKYVTSSNVVAVAHDGKDLWVRFKSGAYRYEGVPESVFYGLMAARSKGEFVAAHVRGQYPYTRV